MEIEGVCLYCEKRRGICRGRGEEKTGGASSVKREKERRLAGHPRRSECISSSSSSFSFLSFISFFLLSVFLLLFFVFKDSEVYCEEAVGYLRGRRLCLACVSHPYTRESQGASQCSQRLHSPCLCACIQASCSLLL